MRAKIRDTELFFDVEGAAIVVDGDRTWEKPVAFLLHGGPGADHTSYKPLFSALSDRLQLVYIDHRGQGRSARGPQSSYTLENNVEDIEALRRYLGLEQIIVIGGSYGGMVAMSYAARYPQCVSHLIAYATVASYEFLPKAQFVLRSLGTPEQIAIARKLWDGQFQSDAELLKYFEVLGSLYSVQSSSSMQLSPEIQIELSHSEFPKLARNSIDRILSHQATNEAFGGFLRTYDIRPQLPKITSPSLILAGRQDWICAPEFSEEIAELIPNSTLQIFENCGHLLRIDQPQKLMGAIGDFLAQHF